MSDQQQSDQGPANANILPEKGRPRGEGKLPGEGLLPGEGKGKLPGEGLPPRVPRPPEEELEDEG